MGNRTITHISKLSIASKTFKKITNTLLRTSWNNRNGLYTYDSQPGFQQIVSYIGSTQLFKKFIKLENTLADKTQKKKEYNIWCQIGSTGLHKEYRKHFKHGGHETSQDLMWNHKSSKQARIRNADYCTNKISKPTKLINQVIFSINQYFPNKFNNCFEKTIPKKFLMPKWIMEKIFPTVYTKILDLELKKIFPKMCVKFDAKWAVSWIQTISGPSS